MKATEKCVALPKHMILRDEAIKKQKQRKWTKTNNDDKRQEGNAYYEINESLRDNE